METQATDEQAQTRGQTDTTKRTKNVLTNESSNESGLPSPPSSTDATRSDSDRNENDSHPADVAGLKTTVSGNKNGSSSGANADGNDKHTLSRLQTDGLDRYGE